MIIDIHAHIGTKGYNMPAHLLIDSMDKHKIDYALVSNIDCGGIENSVDMIFGNQKAIEFALAHNTKIGVFLWCSPCKSKFNKEFENLYLNNKEVVYGLKFHPAISGINFDDSRFEEYVEFANEQNLPILTHCAKDDCSLPSRVYKMAVKYPDANFILGHMGLGTDNVEAMQYIIDVPNIYGDTAWVKPQVVESIFARGGSGKVMFGTDSPINGIDTYDDAVYYDTYFKDFKSLIGNDSFEKLMWRNANKLIIHGSGE